MCLGELLPRLESCQGGQDSEEWEQFPKHTWLSLAEIQERSAEAGA